VIFFCTLLHTLDKLKSKIFIRYWAEVLTKDGSNLKKNKKVPPIS